MHFLKTTFILSFLFHASCMAYSQSDTISIGVKKTIYSQILKENRKIWIYLPASYKDSTYSVKSYPVLYLLDGESHFHSTTGIFRQLSEGLIGNYIIPEKIIIAIENTNRTRDLTPTFTLANLDGKTDSSFKDSGGGENFAAFLKNELIPYVDSVYRTVNHRTIVGHSFGGLAVLNMLLHHPGLFHNYLAIDPSVWWDNRYLIRKLAEVKTTNFDNLQLHIAIANTLPENLSYRKMKKDTTYHSGHIRYIHDLVEQLQKIKYPRFKLTSEYLPNDDHSSSTLISTYNGLRKFYHNYAIKEIWEKDTAFIRNHYLQVSNNLQYKVLPPGRLLALITWYDLQENKLDRALGYALLNKDFYPNSFMVYRMLGDVYAARKEKEKAIENYKRSLQLKGDQKETIKKLEELEK